MDRLADENDMAATVDPEVAKLLDVYAIYNNLDSNKSV